jgi:hypothetical protein
MRVFLFRYVMSDAWHASAGNFKFIKQVLKKGLLKSNRKNED